MPTTKKRVNVSIPENIENVLLKLSQRDGVPVATKAASLIQLAIEIDEDIAANDIAEQRDKKAAVCVSHNDAWK
ncbi:hypothetical protein HON22_00695 [Candidatus Peregrinibacteria bacterium]|jgi:hypothetical protein|nr:hypothetical protein [Candidatus Peregrinibacteria bacterium]